MSTFNDHRLFPLPSEPGFYLWSPTSEQWIQTIASIYFAALVAATLQKQGFSFVAACHVDEQ